MAETPESRAVKTETMNIWLDADIIHWFKSRAKGGKGYQTAINAALRKIVDEARRARSLLYSMKWRLIFS